MKMLEGQIERVYRMRLPAPVMAVMATINTITAEYGETVFAIQEGNDLLFYKPAQPDNRTKQIG